MADVTSAPDDPAPAARRPTIRDVAAEAGVSKSLVSLLYAGGRVGPDRRDRILDAAHRLGFRPNLTARALSAADGGFTGVLVADLHSTVFAEIVDAARAELARSGRRALLTSATIPGADGVPGLDRNALDVFGDLRPRSILMVGSIPALADLAGAVPGIPLVVASAVADGVPVTATVRSDDVAGIRLVVDHLVERGHRRIAHIGGRGGIVAERRAAAYLAAMTAHGLGAEARTAMSDYSEQGGFAAARGLLAADPPTALVCVNDLAAVGALAALADHDGPRVAVTFFFFFFFFFLPCGATAAPRPSSPSPDASASTTRGTPTGRARS